MARMDMTRLDAAVARFGDIQIRGSANEAVPAAEKLGREATSEKQLRRWLADRDIQGGTLAFKAAIRAFDAKNTRGDADVKAPTEADAYDHGEADGHEGRKAAPPYKSEQLKSAYMEGYARGKRARGDSEQIGKVVLHDGKWWYRKTNDTVRHGPYASGSEASSAARAAGVRVDDAKLDAAIARMDATVRRVTAKQLAQKFRDGEWSAVGDITRGGYQEVQSMEDKKRFTVEVTDHKA